MSLHDIRLQKFFGFFISYSDFKPIYVPTTTYELLLSTRDKLRPDIPWASSPVFSCCQLSPFRVSTALFFFFLESRMSCYLFEQPGDWYTHFLTWSKIYISWHNWSSNFVLFLMTHFCFTNPFQLLRFASLILINPTSQSNSL